MGSFGLFMVLVLGLLLGWALYLLRQYKNLTSELMELLERSTKGWQEAVEELKTKQ